MKNSISLKKTASALALSFTSGVCHAATYDSEFQKFIEPLDEGTRIESPIDQEYSPFYENIPAIDQFSLHTGYVDVLELIKLKKYEEARSKINKLLEQFPKEAELYNFLAFIDIQQQNKPAAFTNYNQALALNPKNLTALQSLAMLALEKNDLPLGEELIQRAIESNPKEPLPYILQANIAYRKNNLDDVENILSTARGKVRGDIRHELLIANNLIQLYLTKKLPEKAVDLALDFTRRYPDDKLSLTQLAKTQLFAQKPDESERTLRKIIELDSQDVQNRLLLARLILRRANNTLEAEKLVDEALVLEPGNFNALTLKTALTIREGKFDQGLSQTDTLEKEFPASAAGKLLKAEIYLAQGLTEKAISNALLAYLIQPNPKLLNLIATLQNNQGKGREAIQFVTQELEKNPKDLQLHLLIANLHLLNKHYTKAETHYEIILKEKPNNPMVMNNLATLYYYQNNPKALGFAKKAHSLAPNSGAIADTYGQILLQQGQPDEAVKMLINATTLASNNADIKFHLAQAYQATGDTEKAIEILKMISDGSFEYENKSAAEELLKKLETKLP